MTTIVKTSIHFFLLHCLFILHNELVHACPSGWIAFNTEKCIKYLPVNVHFSEAEQMCKSHNSSMISIHSREEQDFILALGRQHYTLSGVHWIWLGATRNASDSKEFQWRDGSGFNFTNWRDGCPDNRQNENCVLMTIFRDRPSHWCNFKCESNYDHVVCQKEYTNETSTSSSFTPVISYPVSRPSRFPTLRPDRRPYSSSTRRSFVQPLSPPPLPSLESQECDIGWDFKNNKCYKFIPDNITGEEARYYCRRFGESAQGITIMSEAEQAWAVEYAFYKNEAKDAIWVGAVRTGPEAANITWRNGQPMNYTNWAPHEPDNRNNSENCVAMNDTPKFFGRWLDAPCSLKFHLMCEKGSKIPFKEPVYNSSTWNELFSNPGVVFAVPMQQPSPSSQQDPGAENTAVVAKSPPVPASSSTSSSILIFLILLLVIAVAFLAFLVLNQRKQIKNNLRESRVNIYYASSSSAYEPEYEEPKYNDSSNSHAYASTTASLFDSPLAVARSAVTPSHV